MACLDDMGDGLVWAPIEFISAARRLDGNIEFLYGRDASDPLMAGFDYEQDPEMALEYRNAINNVIFGRYVYVTKHDTEDIVKLAIEEGAEYIVFTTENGYTVKRMDELK